MNKLKFIKDVYTGVEIVSFENVDVTYPEHTHIGHYVFGIVTAGTIKIEIKNEIAFITLSICLNAPSS